MEAGYEVEHYFKDDYLGEKYRFALQYNYHEFNLVHTYYLHVLFEPNEHTVAIFKLKPKTNANTIATT